MQKKAGVSLKIETGVSLQEITNLQQRSVRTPHEGPESLHGLVHEQLSNKRGSDAGIMNIYYDRTTCRDIYHHPSYIITGGRKIKIAPTVSNGAREHEMLTTHLNVDCHMFRLELIFPNRNRYTYSEFIKQNQKEFDEMVTVLGKEVFNMGLWNRFVLDNGSVLQRVPTSWEQILDEGIFQITTPNKGWIMPNILNIISMVFIDDRKYRSSKVYQISGAEMYKYIKGMMEQIDELWSILVHYAGASESIEIIMFPTGNARFAAFNQADYYKLELLFKKREEIKSLNEKKAAYFKTLRGAPDKEVLESFNIDGKQLQEQYQDLCYENSNVLYSMSDANFTSQYDMEPGQQIHIHPFCISSTIKDLDDMIDEMRKNILKREKRIKRNFRK